MGGFLMNGCGAAETVRKLRLLKTAHCSTCGKVRDFYLAKIRMKIHVVFIPTIPLNTKYGIVCAKCKTGQYITEEQMKQLMNADEDQKVLLFDAIMNPAHPVSAQAELNPQELEQAFGALLSAEPKPETGKTETPDRKAALKSCPKCGEPVSAKALFCMQCGTALKTPAAEEAKVVSDEGKTENVAPSIPETADTAPAKEPICAKPDAGMWECPLCRTKNDAGMNRCQLCGQAR